jgi:hypothetical protein
MLRIQPRGQHQVDAGLGHQQRALADQSGLRTTLTGHGKPERRAVVESGLLRVADEQLDVVDAVDVHVPLPC